MSQTILKHKEINTSLPDLYEKYSADIFRYSLSILKNYEEARDAVQDVYVKFAENENSFKGDCSPKTWLLVIARNHCYNRLKKKDFYQPRIDENLFENYSQPDYDGKIMLEDALAKISAEYNELIYLKEYEGFSYKEIAEITGLSLENVKIKLFRARQELRRILKNGV